MGYTKLPRSTLWLVEGGTYTFQQKPTTPVQEITIASFYMGKTPITNEQYEAYDSHYQRSSYSPGNDDPAIHISLADARAYCDWYKTQAKKLIRLPTLWEWQYACLGGILKEQHIVKINDPQAFWHEGNSQGQAQTVEKKLANLIGLHDMLGNVWEWVTVKDVPFTRVCGGSYRVPATLIDAYLQKDVDPDVRLDDVGFRIVRSL